MTLILLVFLAVAFCLSAVSAITYAFFWYETSGSPHQARLENISQGKVKRLVAKGIATGFFSLWATVLLFPFGYSRRLAIPKPDGSSSLPPVILVHGLYHNAGAWILYRFLLRKAGFKNLYGFNYSSFRTSFADILRRLDAFATDISIQFGGAPIVLIGHSLGGLLGRALLESPGNSTKVAALATLGTPHNGSRLAALGIGALARSLAFKGRLVRELSESSRIPSAVPRLAAYSPIDNMVLPFESLKAVGPEWSHFETRPVSHVSLLFHKQTADAVVVFLSAALTQRSKT